jgi:hypothetical protein
MLGDGINVAAWLEAVCPAGGVCVLRVARGHVATGSIIRSSHLAPSCSRKSPSGRGVRVACRSGDGRFKSPGGLSELIDAESGVHPEPECYDQAVEDVFAVQNEITDDVAFAIRRRSPVQSRNAPCANRRRPSARGSCVNAGSGIVRMVARRPFHLCRSMVFSGDMCPGSERKTTRLCWTVCARRVGWSERTAKRPARGPAFRRHRKSLVSHRHLPWGCFRRAGQMPDDLCRRTRHHSR